MEFGSIRNRVVLTVLVFLFTAGAIFFGTGMHPWWPALWIGPIPILLFSLHAGLSTTALLAIASMLAGMLNVWSYIALLHAPPVVWFASCGIEAVAFAAAVLLFRALVRRGFTLRALIAFPAAMVAFEYVRNLTWVHGTGASLAYSQLDFLPFVQLASLTGPWGMTFLLFLFPAGLALALHLRRSNPKRAWRMLASGVLPLGAVLIFGMLRLASPDPQQRVRVGLIASDLPANVFVADEGLPTQRLLQAYADKAEKLIARGAQVIVLPEKLGVLIHSNEGGADAVLQQLADRTGATIVAGAVFVASSSKYNQARVYTPRSAVLVYNKHHLLPPFESNLTPGKELTVLHKPQQTWGVAICKDMDFTGLSRRYNRERAGLMLVPAWDFNMDRIWHGHMAILRGVEDGFSIARSAKQGYLTVSDSRGRILAEARSDAGDFATLLADVPVGHSATLYASLGDWCAWLALAAVLLGLVSLGQDGTIEGPLKGKVAVPELANLRPV